MIRAYWHVLILSDDGAVERANADLLSWAKAESLAALLRTTGANAIAARASTERIQRGNT